MLWRRRLWGISAITRLRSAKEKGEDWNQDVSNYVRYPQGLEDEPTGSTLLEEDNLGHSLGRSPDLDILDRDNRSL